MGDDSGRRVGGQRGEWELATVGYTYMYMHMIVTGGQVLACVWVRVSRVVMVARWLPHACIRMCQCQGDGW